MCDSPWLTNGEEKKTSFQQMSNIVQNRPRLNMDPMSGNFVVVDTMEKQG